MPSGLGAHSSKALLTPQLTGRFDAVAVRHTRVSAAVRSLLALVFLSCGQSAGSSQHTPLQQWHAAAEPSVVIGVAVGDSLAEFSRIATARLVGPEGRIVVVNQRSPMVRVFDHEGRSLLAFGGEGYGPREFGAIAALSIRRDTMELTDWLRNRLSLWTLDGTFLDVITLPPTPGDFPTILGRLESGELLARTSLSSGNTRGLSSDSMILLRITADGSKRTQVGRFFREQSFTISQGRGTTTYPAPISPHGHWAIATRGLWYSNGADSMLYNYDWEGAVRLAIGLPIQLKLTEQRDRDAYGERWIGSVSRSARPRLRSVLKRMSFPRTLPAVTALVASHDGKLWVGTSIHAGEMIREWYLLDAAGELIAQVSLPAALSVTDAATGYVLGTGRDSLGVARVFVFDLIRGGPF